MPNINLCEEITEVKEAIVINLYGGPGSGKSSTMAGVFSGLKWLGLNCEMAPEFAKEKVWEESTRVLENQIYVFGKQLHTIFRVKDKVDVVITDSPLLLSLIYGSHIGENFRNLVLETYNGFHNINYFLNRVKKYNPAGRLQNEEKARGIDDALRAMMVENDIFCYSLDAGPDSVDNIVNDIVSVLPKDKFEYS